MPNLTDRKLKHLAPGEWISDGGPRGGGTLVARRLTSGSTMFYFRYTAPGGRRDVIPLGEFGSHDLSLDAARDKAGAYSIRYRAGDRNLRAALASERHAAEQQQRIKDTRTLGALLRAYTDQLERDGRKSAREVRRVLTRYVEESFPECWNRALEDVTADDLLNIVAAPVDANKLRQAEMLRAYLRAAFSAGIKARRNPKALPALRELAVTINPAAMLTPIEGADRARTRALSRSELRAYWDRIQAPELAVLRFHLLGGAQRVRQLARAKVSDYDADAHTLTLADPKGRRSQPREYALPLIPAAVDAMLALHGGAYGPYVFTVTAGASGAGYLSVASRVRRVAQAMLAAGELRGGMFTVGDLRRTVETRLAEAGVTRETRARLQSHGLTGVQVRHYNKYEYVPEMRAALETLYRLLTARDSNVVEFKRAEA